MVELVNELGYRGLTVRALTRTSEVSTRSFYSHYANVDEAFASTCEWLVGCAAERSETALRGAEGPGRGLRQGLLGLLGAMAEDPAAARLVLVDAYAAETAVRERIGAAKREFERLLARPLAAAPDRAPVPDRVFEGMVAGVEFIARSRLRAGLAAELPALAAALGAWILSLGDAEEQPPREIAAGPAADTGAGRVGSLAAALRGETGNERGRLLVAVTRLASAEGYATLTVPKIRAEAGVSRRSFDAHFDGVEECFLAALEVLTAAALAHAERLLTAGDDWETNVERATLALCTEVARDPAAGRLVLVEVLAPGLEGLYFRGEAIRLIASRLRAAAPRERRPSELAAEASTAAAWQIVQAEVAAGQGAALPQLAATLARVLTRPAAVST